jgi:hypothetical protein
MITVRVRWALTVVAVLVVVTGLSAQDARSPQPQAIQPAQVPQRCLHGPSEDATQRNRREQALALAREINRAENAGPAVIPGERREYQPLNRLRVPAAPSGFRVQLSTDGATYTFSIKDTLDPCRYAVFSDQDQVIYEAVARTGVFVRPADIP